MLPQIPPHSEAVGTQSEPQQVSLGPQVFPQMPPHNVFVGVQIEPQQV
jgi:hypothetical protein